MARLAQAAKVRLVVGAAVFERDHVVGLGDRRVPATGQAVLAQRVGFDVGRADLSPPVVVASVDLRLALILAVASVLGASMLGAEPGVSQLGTPRLGARALGFDRHQAPHPCRSWQRPPDGSRGCVWGSGPTFQPLTACDRHTLKVIPSSRHSCAPMVSLCRTRDARSGQGRAASWRRQSCVRRRSVRQL